MTWADFIAECDNLIAERERALEAIPVEIQKLRASKRYFTRQRHTSGLTWDEWCKTLGIKSSTPERNHQMANDPTRQVHTATHPSGHPNKTPVNEQNPIFGRPVDAVITQVSPMQKRINDGEMTGSDTRFIDRLGDEAAGSGTERYKSNADDWTQTKGAGITADTSAVGTDAEHDLGGHASNSSSITPVKVVGLPTQEQAQAVKEEAAQERAERRIETKNYMDGSSATGVAPLPDKSPAQQDALEAVVQQDPQLREPVPERTA
jgi:hypothetical protein